MENMNEYNNIYVVGDDVVNDIVSALKKKPEGLTITELVKETKKSRSKIRITLAKLEGANKVKVRKIGMAKMYTLQK